MALHLLISVATSLINVIRDQQSIQIGSPNTAIINKTKLPTIFIYTEATDATETWLKLGN